MTEKQLFIKELDLDMINPNMENMHISDQGGSKIVVIGKPGSGKSWLIKYLLYKKKHIIPVGMVCSGSEDSNKFYNSIFPSTFIYNQVDENAVTNFKRRQRIAIRYLKNPWSVLIIDDCMDDPHLFKTRLFGDLFKNGRHWKSMFILAMQYCMDIPPALRICIDGSFIFREPNLQFRKKIYENYASIIPDFKTFCDILDQITDDYTALYIRNNISSNSLEDCIFWFKADRVEDHFQFGSDDYWRFHRIRFDADYKSPL
jgi:hypothetical protein